MSDAVRVGLSYMAESTFGVTPSATALKDVRLTGESLAQETTVINSAEIRSDRQIAYVARTDLRASGGVNIELSYGVYDDLFQYALLSGVWTTPASALTGTVYSMASGSNTLHRSSGDFTAGFPALAAGHWIKISGFATAANNGFFKVVSVAATDIVLTGALVTTEAAGASVTISQSAWIATGTTPKSMTWERRYLDLSNEFAIFKGLEIEQLALNLSVGQVITGSFDFMGVSESSATATVGNAYTAAPTNDVMNCVDNILSVIENNAASSVVLSYGFQLKNNLRARNVIGTLGPISLGTGTIDLTGTFQAYYASKTLIDKYLAFTTTQLAFVARDGGGNAYVIDFPRVKLTAGKRVAGGINTDVVADMTFSAFRDPTEQITCRISRWAGP